MKTKAKKGKRIYTVDSKTMNSPKAMANLIDDIVRVEFDVKEKKKKK